MSKFLVINGPNLNLLGTRETSIYGDRSLADLEQELTKLAQSFNHTIMFKQHNSEGDFINTIHQAIKDDVDFMIINAGAYTHTSIAIRDAILGVSIPFIEVHISNVFRREMYRRKSFLSDIAKGVIVGVGTHGYEFALIAGDDYLNNQQSK